MPWRPAERRCKRRSSAASVSVEGAISGIADRAHGRRGNPRHWLQVTPQGGSIGSPAASLAHGHRCHCVRELGRASRYMLVALHYRSFRPAVARLSPALHTPYRPLRTASLAAAASSAAGTTPAAGTAGGGGAGSGSRTCPPSAATMGKTSIIWFRKVGSGRAGCTGRFALLCLALPPSPSGRLKNTLTCQRRRPPTVTAGPAPA